MLYITYSIKEYSQWFQGEANFIANSLSCDNDRTDSKLTNLFHVHCPSQIPGHFVIQPLPNKITSWLTALLLRLPMKLQLQEKHTRTKLGHGQKGQPTAAGLDSRTQSSTTSHAMHESNSSGPLPWLCKKPVFQDHLMSDWLKAQSQVPSYTYVRPSASTVNPIHPWTTTARLNSFYNKN